MALFLLHAPDRFGQHLAGDEALLQQDAPQRLAEDVRSHRHRIPLDEDDDLLGGLVQQQQRPRRPLRVEALEQARERRALQGPLQLGVVGVGRQRLGAALDVAALALLGRIAQAVLRHRRRRDLIGDVHRFRCRGRAARRELRHPRCQAREIQGRRQVVRGREPAARLGAMADAAVGAGHEHDRCRARLGALPELVGEGESVTVDQPGVDHDDVGHARDDGALGPGRLRLGVQLEAGLAQRRPDLPLQIRVALDDQHVPGHDGGSVTQARLRALGRLPRPVGLGHTRPR